VSSVALDGHGFNLHATQCLCFACIDLAEPSEVTDNDQRATQTSMSAVQNTADISEDLVSSPDSGFSEDTGSTEDGCHFGSTNLSEDQSSALKSVKVVDESAETSAVTQTSGEKSNDAATQRKRKKISKIHHSVTNYSNAFVWRSVSRRIAYHIDHVFYSLYTVSIKK